MRRQFLTRRYWLRVAGNFLFLLVIYTIISYFFHEHDDPFWSLAAIQKRYGFAFFMAVLFAYRQREQPAFNQDPNEDSIKNKWTAKEFFLIVLLLFLFASIIMTVLFGIGWIVKSFVSHSEEPVGRTYLKAITVAGVMCLFTVLILFVSDWFGMRWERRP